MYINDTHTVTLDEAAYGVTKALLPFLIESGTPVAIRRDGWLLMVSTSIAGPPPARLPKSTMKKPGGNLPTPS
nr:MAG TPA: hypothetical protein [Caudoviricetes sp.]